jgi:CRP-like cAMP-binding protein
MIASPIASMLDEAVATIPREGQSVLPSAHKRPLSFRPERAAEGESIAARLSALPLFSELPTDRLRSVARQLIVETRDADESLCESGAPEGPLYVILSGTAWVGLAGRASPVALVSAGDVVGEIAALYGGPRTATIIAREPIETVAIAPSIVRAMAREFAGFRESLLESITERMRESLPEIAPCMRRLSADARRELMDLAVFVEIAEGEELIIEGEPAPALFVVAAGEAECFGGELGVRHAVRVRVGEMMGAASVLESVPAGVTARASRALLIAKMQADAVQKLMPAHASLRELLEDVTNPGKGVVC